MSLESWQCFCSAALLRRHKQIHMTVLRSHWESVSNSQQEELGPAVGADHAVFYVPAVGNGEILGVLVVPKGRFEGIRVIPSVQGDTVKIAVSALLADKRKLSEARCSEIRSWPSVDAGSYEGKEDASLPLTGLGKLGLPVLQMDVVPAKGPPPGGWHHPYANFMAFCSCESTRDELNPSIGILGYPDAEKCTEIGKCGRCCRISLP